MNKLELIVRTLDNKLGKDITAINMELISPIYDTFVICSAANERMIQSLRDNVEDELAKEGYFVRKIEGNKTSKWVLMDYGDIIVHIFDSEERKNYNLEKLWADMPRINIEEYLDL